jgi:hypothetical protein
MFIVAVLEQKNEKLEWRGGLPWCRRRELNPYDLAVIGF